MIDSVSLTDCSERKSVEEALRHQWLKSASLENHGPHLDISNIKTFLCKEQNKPIVPVRKFTMLICTIAHCSLYYVLYKSCNKGS